MSKISRQSVDRVILVVLIVVAGGWCWSARASRPTVQLVDGTYHNACCAAVRLKDGVMFTDTARVRFTLSNMKYGLEATPAIPVEVSGGQVTARADAETERILFNEDRTAFFLCGPAGCEYQFTRS